MLDFLIFAATVVIFLIIAVIYLYPGSKRITTIPGPEPVDPLEGNIPDIISCGSLTEFLEKVHEDYGPIVSFWMGTTMYVSIGSAKMFADQAGVFDHACELFAPSVLLFGKSSVHVTNGAEGRRRHAMYSKCFTQTAINRFYATYNQLSGELVESWKKFPSGEFIPLKEQVMNFAIRAILQATLGEPAADDQLVKRVHVCYDVCMTEIGDRMKGDIPEAGRTREKRFEQHMEELAEIMCNCVKKHKEHLSDDGDTSLIDAARSLKIPEETVIADLMAFFIGGFHTSAALAIWAIYYIALFEDIQEQLREEVQSVVGAKGDITPDDIDNMPYLRQVLNETLRHDMAVWATRVQDIDTMIGGHQIPAGTPVIHALGVALNDPEVYPEPDRFDPDRFSKEKMKSLPPFAFEPFGFAGKRKCPGYRFSLAEVSVLIVSLLRANLHLSLAPDQSVEPVFTMVPLPREEVWLTLDQAPDA